MNETLPKTARARPSASGRNRWAGWRIVVAVVLIGGGLAAYFTLRGSDFHYKYATARTQNGVGGYAFSYPPSWVVTRAGTTSKIESP
ncbi:MAG TPA: hypothetical protein VF972_11170, partial [Actinomycetota bacterium]